MGGNARRAGCTSPARFVPDWRARHACCPKDATLLLVTLLPKVRTFRTLETNCSWASLNVGVVDAATAAVGVAGPDEADGGGPTAGPQAVSPAPRAAAAMIGGTARRVKVRRFMIHPSSGFPAERTTPLSTPVDHPDVGRLTRS